MQSLIQRSASTLVANTSTPSAWQRTLRKSSDYSWRRSSTPASLWLRSLASPSKLLPPEKALLAMLLNSWVILLTTSSKLSLKIHNNILLLLGVIIMSYSSCYLLKSSSLPFILLVLPSFTTWMRMLINCAIYLYCVHLLYLKTVYLYYLIFCSEINFNQMTVLNSKCIQSICTLNTICKINFIVIC